MDKYRKVTRDDWKQAFLYVAAAIGVIAVTAILTVPIRWPAGFIIWLLIVSIDVFLLVRWHARNFGYLCPRCGNAFAITTCREFISPNGWNRKYLRCPRCGQKAWMGLLKKTR